MSRKAELLFISESFIFPLKILKIKIHKKNGSCCIIIYVKLGISHRFEKWVR